MIHYCRHRKGVGCEVFHPIAVVLTGRIAHERDGVPHLYTMLVRPKAEQRDLALVRGQRALHMYGHVNSFGKALELKDVAFFVLEHLGKGAVARFHLCYAVDGFDLLDVVLGHAVGKLNLHVVHVAQSKRFVDRVAQGQATPRNAKEQADAQAHKHTYGDKGHDVGSYLCKQFCDAYPLHTYLLAITRDRTRELCGG